MGPVSGFTDAASFKYLDQSTLRECPVGDPREAVFVVVYTSGTTGLPKGVELTHHSFIANFCISKHLTGTIGNSYKATKMASEYLLVEVKRDTPYEKFTDLVAFEEKPITLTALRAMNTVEYFLSDDNLVLDPVSRVKLGPNEPGEICFRIPTVMRGYYKQPKETAEFFEGNGWCRSGDIGYYDKEGRFYFVQRLKEMIKCMDNQVVPAELEQLLLQELSEDIAEVTVVGLPHTLFGETPAAAVVPRDQYMCHKAAGPLVDKIKSTIAGAVPLLCQ
ncbi:uncharacterized protein LOC142767794 [Rhipicephalus microplus]|uniref:uncharacterized protein LOC142767794 n=1 Tax=Rhipicephalus microplus TaxID=6941 RepID=UPI003F6C9196